MTKVDLWGTKIEESPKETRWNIVMESLSDLNNAYNLRDSILSDQVEMALDRLMSAYDIWLD